jgi:hypothetical protein
MTDHFNKACCIATISYTDSHANLSVQRHQLQGARRRAVGSSADVEGQPERWCGGVAVGRKLPGSAAGDDVDPRGWEEIRRRLMTSIRADGRRFGGG